MKSMDGDKNRGENNTKQHDRFTYMYYKHTVQLTRSLCVKTFLLYTWMHLRLPPPASFPHTHASLENDTQSAIPKLSVSIHTCNAVLHENER